MADDQNIFATFREKLDASPFVMIGLDETPDHSEPMTAQLDDGDARTLWFFMGRDNRLAMGGPAMAQFVAKGHDFFACVHGTLTADHDRAMIDRLWSKQVEAWFPEGKEDPNLLLMRLSLDSGEFWESDISMSGRLKMLFGSTIQPQEAGSHAEMPL